MSDHVRIEPDGLYLYTWDSDLRYDVRTHIEQDRVIASLRRACVIADGVTLLDIFRMVESYESLKDFVGRYSWCRAIDEFHAQAEEPMRKGEDDGDNGPLDYLEIRHVVGCHKRKGGHIDFGMHLDFHGIRKIIDPVAFETRNGYAPPKEGIERYGVSYSPMYDLADLPVRLNEDIEIVVLDRKHQPASEMIQATADFSLLEVLDAIYDDVSFMGGPADNREFLEEMNEMVAGIKDGTVPVETVEFDLDAAIRKLDEDDDGGVDLS